MMAAMSNERLRAELLRQSVSAETLAEIVGVHPKSVQRWITHAVLPHTRHRISTAQFLGVDELRLWPELLSSTRTRAATQGELLAYYPTRGAMPISTWDEVLGRTRHHIDLLAFSATFLHDSVDGFLDALRAKAEAGCHIRLLFGDPNSDAVALRGHEEETGVDMANRVQATWRMYTPLLDQPGIIARQHSTTLYNSIYRFDDDMLVNTHVYGNYAARSPFLHLRHIDTGQLFVTYLDSFERVWESGTPPTL